MQPLVRFVRWYFILNKRLFYIAFLSLTFFSAKAQQEYKYFKVVDSALVGISDALANTTTLGMAYFSSEEGVISIPVDSVLKHKGFLFTAPGFNPKYVKVLNQNQNSVIVLSRYKKMTLTEEMRLEGFTFMKSVYLSEHSEYKRIKVGILQKRQMTLNNVPIEIKGISGRLVPSRKDSGMVLSSLRWSDVAYGKTHFVQEKVHSRIDSGLFRRMGEWTSLDFLWTIRPSNFYLDPLSNLEYPNPVHQKNALLYNYYLIDSVSFMNTKLYRVKIIAAKSFSPLFSGDVWIENKKGNVVELHIKLLKENHINFVDSLGLHFYNNLTSNSGDGNAQFAQVWLNILGYKLNLKISSLLINDIPESLNFDNKWRVLEEDLASTDTLKYFYGFINGNKNILDDLEDNTHSIKSKEYKLDKIFLNPVRFSKAFFLTGANYKLGKGYYEMTPFFLTNGFNTVEGWYFNYRGNYYLKFTDARLKVSPYLRYGFALKKVMPKLEIEYKFNLYDPIKIIIEGGRKVQQFNQLEPINPGINMLYSLGFGINYMKLYQKDYVKFTFDKEIMRGLELVVSFEAARREALFNNSTFNLFGFGDLYTLNNPDRPPAINSETGFETHFSNTMELQLYYQFGRRYDFINNKLVKLESNLPRLSLVYRKGFGYKSGMPNFDYIRFGIGSKTRIRDVGLFEVDFVIGAFYNVESIEFADYQHFNGVQTAFINNTYDGWTDVRQFSTLPYYDYSTRERFVEIHLKHRFLGWLLSKPKVLKRFTLQSYVGSNFLYTSDVGQYTEVYMGVENILRIFNIQLAAGINREGDLRGSVLLGINFDYMFYINSVNH